MNTVWIQWFSFVCSLLKFSFYKLTFCGPHPSKLPKKVFACSKVEEEYFWPVKLCNQSKVSWLVGRGRRYSIFPKNEYLYWMNNQIIFWMNEFFEWIFWPYNWMNYWMNQKSALFIRKMNKKCLFWTERAPFACFSLFSQAVICFPIWMNNFIEWIFSIQFWIEYWIESFFGPIQRKNE